MASNVFTKKDILQNLASRGCFIDVYTLDTFFAEKKIEAIFEDTNGTEFYDQNALNAVLDSLTDNKTDNLTSQPKIQNQNTPQISYESKKEFSQGEQQIDKDVKEAMDFINDISLSDGSLLKNRIDGIGNLAPKTASDMQEEQSEENLLDKFEQSVNDSKNIESQIANASSLTTDVQSANKINDEMFDISPEDLNNIDTSSYDDISLLSESYEAQEKFRQYVMSEMSKNNMDMPQQRQPMYGGIGNEFKLDISERTLNMIARTMAKKIAKYVGSIMAQDQKQSSKVAEYEEENRRLTQKTRELEDQNRKLRLLLAESNKNLNSFKPSIFGLYKKVDPKKNKK